MRSLCKDLLRSYQEFSAYKKISEKDDFPQATYVKNTLRVKSTQILFKNKPNLGLGLNTTIEKAGKQISVCNFHGISQPGNKLDTPERLEQSKLIIEFFREIPKPHIIGGDFNLEAETKSVRIFEKHGYQNLIRAFNISTTRNEYVWNRYPSHKQFFSDFIFVSRGVKITDFFVPKVEVSDHLPLILEIKI